MPTKTVKLKTNDAGGVSLAHPALHPGSQTDQGACVVALERVPAQLPTATVLTAPAAAQGARGARTIDRGTKALRFGCGLNSLRPAKALASANVSLGG